MRKVLIILACLLSSPAFAATICKDFNDVSNTPTNHLVKRGSEVSVQIERTVGSGAVGSYKLETSDSDVTYVAEGAAFSTIGITEFTGIIEQFVRISIGTSPDVGTTVRVCIYADGPGE